MSHPAPLLALLLLALFGCAPTAPFCPAGLPVYDHILIVVEEQKVGH